MLDPDAAIEKGRGDLRWFIETNFTIIDKDSKRVPFIFNSVQDDYWNAITPSGVILKARKMGFTTLRIARSLAMCMTRKNQRCILVSHEKDATTRLLRLAHDMVETCGLHIDVGRKSDKEITFPSTNSSFWIGTAGSQAFGRGDSITSYHLSEFAFWGNTDLITGIEEACVNDAEGCIESTANGWGTEYHSLWKRAEVGGEDVSTDVYETDTDGGPVARKFYKPHFYAWFRDPTYSIPVTRPLEDLREDERDLKERYDLTDSQIAWRRSKIASMSHPEKFPQEFPATPEEAFLVSGSMVFDAYALRQMKESARPVQWRGEIVERNAAVKLDMNKNGRFRIYIPPRDGRAYVVSADIAIGVDGGNYSVADVWDCETWEQVAQWHGHTPPDDFGDRLMLIGSFYNWAFLAPEVNNHGLTTCVRIRDAGYPKLLIRSDNLGGQDMGWYTSPGESGTRSELISAYGKALRTNACKLNSPISIHEAMSFVRLENGKLGAQGSNKKGDKKSAFDDTVFSGGIGIRMLELGVQEPERGFEGLRDHLGLVGRKRKRSGLRITVLSRGGY